MTEIAITAADREWATAIRAALIRGSDGMPSYPVDIIPPVVAQIRHQARAEALEEAAKAAEAVGAPLFAEAKRLGHRDIEGVTLRIMQGDGAQAAAEAIRALSLGGSD